MIIRKMKKDDLEHLVIQDEQKHEVCSAPYPEDTSFTLEEDGKVIGVFGLYDTGCGRGQLFSYISKEAGSYMLKMVRQLKALIDEGMKKTNIVRLEFTVLEDFEHGNRFAKMLGFECEGVMRKYYKGRNYKLYARVK